MKTIIIALLLATLVVLSACQQTVETPGLADPFIGGDAAIVLYLQEGLPPAVIYDKEKSTFGVGIALENVGEANVGAGTDNPHVYVKLEGINPAHFMISKDDTVKDLKDMGERLDGAKKNFDGTIFPGQITNVIFEPLTYKPDIKGNFEVTLRADVCYDYVTYVSTPICIKDDALENLADATICTLTGEKYPRNSGGPVHISSLIQNPLADNKYQINLVIEHVGMGEFFQRLDKGNLGDQGEGTPYYPCDHSVTNPDKFEVYVEVLPIEGLEIDCHRLSEDTKGFVKLYNGAPTRMSCTITKTDPDIGTRAYEEILNINLWYMYSEFIETPILIQDVTN